MSVVRLDKLIANITMQTRSDVKKLIRSGRVKINAEVCKVVDYKIDTQKDVLIIDDEEKIIKEKIYLMMNKPSGVISATVDKVDKTVIDIVPQKYKRKDLFPIGRLDKDTQGLLIITNDGEFAHKITSPSKNIFKKYEAKLDGNFTKVMQKSFECGIILKNGEKCKPAYTQIIDIDNKIVQIQICEGKYHQVKRMFASVGLKVLNLERLEIGSLKLDSKLNKGECKELSEIDKLQIFISNIT